MKRISVLILVALWALTGMVYGASSLTSGDQTIYGNKTFEHNTVFKGDVTILGALLGATQYSSIFYVNSETGHDSPGNYGKTYLKPFATIEFAVGRTTAEKGDIIFVLPSHVEEITGAGDIYIDVAGVQVIGLGSGSDMAQIHFDNTSASVVMGANDTALINMRFVVSANAIAVMVDVEDGVTGVAIIDCEFGFEESGNDEYAIGIRLGNGSNNALIEGNQFLITGATATVSIILLNDDTDATIIRNNWFTGAVSAAAINSAGTASTNLLIRDNLFLISGSTPILSLYTASTGIFMNNILVVGAANYATAADIATLHNMNNEFIDNADVGGTNTSILDTSTVSCTVTTDG